MVAIVISTIYAFLLCGGAHAALGSSGVELGSYKIDEGAISVSGLSSGGFMASQIHVIESKTFMGVGIIAGGPYNCADGSLSTALTACMSSPYLINVNNLVNNAKTQASVGTIDPLDNLLNTKVYMYSGTDDTTVRPGVVDKTGEFYQSLDVKPENILYKNDLLSVHGFPTMNYGTACNQINRKEYINDCNYDSAYALLNHIYDNTITEPSSYMSSPAGTLLTFDQGEYVDSPASTSSISMDSTGYLFVPDSCTDGTKVCKLHVAFHGCKQGKSYIGDSYAVHTGYNRVAALNDIIVLYPQATATSVSNPNGCWDFWGYTDDQYDFYNGKQIKTVMNMLAKLTGGSTGDTNPPTPKTTTESTTDKSTTVTSTIVTETSSSTTTTASSSGNGILGSYGADSSAVSVSGLGSGGFMAIQVHVAESNQIIGAGAVEGGPYYCARDNVLTATSSCMYAPYAINLNSLYSDAAGYAADGDIASLNNLENSKVYLYSGSKDLSVDSGVVEKAVTFYTNYGADVSAEYSIPSRDGFPTVNKGGPCETLNDNALNSCGFPGAYNVLNHIYGGSLQMPDYTSAVDGELFEFNQNEAIGETQSSTGISLSDHGMVFVPTACSQGHISCRVHVAFHGCKNGNDDIAEDFAKDAGYNEVAALNNIIVIYPRTEINLFYNPQDCWDWWGYTDKNYATSQGVQIKAIMAMIDRVTS